MRGVYAYVPSPHDTRDGEQRQALATLTARLVEAGVVGICPLGSSGEVAYVDDDEAATVVGEVTAACGGAAAVAPGITGTSTDELARRVARMGELGADEVVVVPRPYYSAEHVDWFGLYERLAREESGGLIHYSHKGVLGYELDAATIAELVGQGWLAGVKDAAGVTGRILSIGLHSDWQARVYAGSAHPPTAAYACGAAGWMGGPVCLAPEVGVALWDALERGDTARAWRLQTWLWPLQQAFSAYGIAPFLKAALELQGYAFGPPRAPLRGLTPDQRDEVKQLLARPYPDELDGRG